MENGCCLNMNIKDKFDSYFTNKKKNLIEVSIEDMAGNKSQKNFMFYRN